MESFVLKHFHFWTGTALQMDDRFLQKSNDGIIEKNCDTQGKDLQTQYTVSFACMRNKCGKKLRSER